MPALHTLGILSISFTWNAFPTVLKEFPLMLRTCWLVFLFLVFLHSSNSSQTISIGLRSGDCGGKGHLIQHFITLLGQIVLTQPGGVLGYCPVEKQIIVPLSTKNRWDGVSLHTTVVAMLVKCALIPSVSSEQLMLRCVCYLN